MNYQEFLARKHISDAPSGLTDIPPLNPMLFEFQRDIVKWALRRGRANIFARYGLGKTPMQAEWCLRLVEATGGKALIVAPLAVSHQTIREGRKFGIPINWCATGDDVKPGVNITNYQKLHKFDLSVFMIVALDEGNILRDFTGKYRNEIIERTSRTPYRLVCTATPSPNDFMELGNYAEFQGVMTRSEMLSMFFIHDGSDTSQWRLKGHAESEFWRWLCSFSVMITKPSDFGYEDGGFILPPRTVHEHVVESSGKACDGMLFEMPALTLRERQQARKNSIKERCELAAEIALSDDSPCLIWCDLNEESRMLSKLLGAYDPGALRKTCEVTGSMSDDEKERAIFGFIDGTYTRMVSKPSICGHGMNLQHCWRDIFTGLSDSFEAIDQAGHRIYRFGQTHPVESHIIISRMEGAVRSNILRKERNFEHMTAEMLKHMRDINQQELRGTARQRTDYTPAHQFQLPDWIKAA